jgi:FkbM family methyltransferase
VVKFWKGCVVLTSNAFDPVALIRTVLGPRAFALAGAPPDPELRALLKLGEAAAAEDPELAVTLSSITTPRVRALFGGETSFRTTAGLRFTVDGADVFAATLAAGYLPEARDFEAIMQLVRPGSVVVDVGANFGLYALSAALYARPQGRVFAFEPAPNAFALLERNIADNGLSGVVTAKPVAVGAAARRAAFYIGRDVSFSSLHRTKRLDDDAGTIDVEIVALDAALAHIQSVDLFKIDVEGGEADVLRGARELLRRSRAPIVQFEFSHKNIDETRRAAFEETLALLASDGFRIYRRGAGGPGGLPALSEGFSGNLFLAREGDGAERLRRALERTGKADDGMRDLAALALLQRIAAYTEDLQRAELLQREAILVADSIVGDRVSGGSEAVRAMQQAWLEARKRALDAENQVNSLSASVEGRDRLMEQTSEKIASLRSVILGLEARTGGLEEERNHLLEKTNSLRASIDQLSNSLEQARAHVAATEARNVERTAGWRETEAKLRQRVDELKAALDASNAKVETWRDVEGRLRTRADALDAALKATQEKLAANQADNAQVRERLTELTAYKTTLEAKAARLEKIAKQLQERCLQLQAQLGVEAGADETTSS